MTSSRKIHILFVEIFGFVTFLAFIKRILRTLLNGLFGEDSFLKSFLYVLTTAIVLLFLAYPLPSGFAFAVTYYATGSLLVPIAAHTFINWFPVYAKVLYARGHTCEAYALMLILGICYLFVCYLGRKELKALAMKTKDLFVEPGLRKTTLGFFLGLIYLAFMWGRNYLEKNSGPLVYLSLIGAFSLLCLGYSYRNRKGRTNRQ